ncbi:MAG: hypothetical protein WCX65_05275 [bacterium]
MKKKLKRFLKCFLIVNLVNIAIILIALTIADSAGKKPLYYDQRMPGVIGRVNEALKDYVGELHVAKLFTTDMKHAYIKITQKKKPVAQIKRKIIQQSAAAEPSTLLLNGFNFVYRENPHRMSLFEASINGIVSGKSKVSGVVSTAFEGGDWSRIDGASYKIDALPVSSKQARFSHGSAALKLKDGRSKIAMKLNLADLNMAGYPTVMPVLRGFRFDTKKEIPDGLNIKGVTVKLIPVSRNGDILEFDILIELKGGAVAFRPSPGYIYNVESEVFYTLIGGDAGSFARADAHYMMLNRETAPERVRLASSSFGTGGAAQVFPAIQGFEYDIHTTKARFIREINLNLGAVKYDPASGRVSADCAGYLSNDGTFAGALDVRFSADVLFVRIPDVKILKNILVSDKITDVTKTNTWEIDAGL